MSDNAAARPPSAARKKENRPKPVSSISVADRRFRIIKRSDRPWQWRSYPLLGGWVLLMRQSTVRSQSVSCGLRSVTTRWRLTRHKDRSKRRFGIRHSIVFWRSQAVPTRQHANGRACPGKQARRSRPACWFGLRREEPRCPAGKVSNALRLAVSSRSASRNRRVVCSSAVRSSEPKKTFEI